LKHIILGYSYNCHVYLTILLFKSFLVNGTLLEKINNFLIHTIIHKHKKNIYRNRFYKIQDNSFMLLGIILNDSNEEKICKIIYWS